MILLNNLIVVEFFFLYLPSDLVAIVLSVIAGFPHIASSFLLFLNAFLRFAPQRILI
jgi:hypothetical protein